MVIKDFQIVADSIVKAYLQCKNLGQSQGVKLAQEQIKERLNYNFSDFDPDQFDEYIEKKFNLKNDKDNG